eukprot:jgi/Chrzof1/10490/Cz05g00150.t1
METTLLMQVRSSLPALITLRLQEPSLRLHGALEAAVVQRMQVATLELDGFYSDDNSMAPVNTPNALPVLLTSMHWLKKVVMPSGSNYAASRDDPELDAVIFALAGLPALQEAVFSSPFLSPSEHQLSVLAMSRSIRRIRLLGRQWYIAMPGGRDAWHAEMALVAHARKLEKQNCQLIISIDSDGFDCRRALQDGLLTD